MAAVLASSILRWTSEKLSSLIPAPSSSDAGALQDLWRLERTMRRVHAILADADETDVIRDPSAELRLRELKDVAYDAEDAVEEYEYEVLRSKIQGPGHEHKHREAVVSGSSSSGPIVVPVPDELASRVKQIRERFDEINRDWRALRWRKSDGRRRRDSHAISRRETSSFVHEPSVLGRETEKEDVIGKLLSEGGSSVGPVSVLAIVGMGGLGKTTLAQLVYNDSRVCRHFDVRGWVCISEVPDAKNLIRNIIMSLTSRNNFDSLDLDGLQRFLGDRVRGGSFLLVLDDVWDMTPSLWDCIRIPLTNAGSGRILVTTRDERVARIMQTTPPCCMGFLGLEDCWLLFKQVAFESLDPDARPNLQVIGRKIVEKCGGVPLAVKAIGGALRFEDDEERWRDVSESELWQEDVGTDGILSALKLSYDRMPPRLKQCFVFLALFPKDYIISKGHVIRLWMAVGVLRSEGKRLMEDVGSRYIDELLQRSMIQKYNSQLFTMHDHMHDLAQLVAGEEFLTIPIRNLESISSNVRYLSVIVSGASQFPNLQPLQRSRALRVLQFLVPQFSADETLAVEMSNEVLRNLRQLRVLHLDQTKSEPFPDSIGNLKYLRSLSTDYNCLVTELPTSICSLYNLQTLHVPSAYLKQLPEGIYNLVNLQHLAVGADTCIPSGIGQLKSLTTLGSFYIQAGNWHSRLCELKHLVNLKGNLCIGGLRNLVGAEDAREADLQSKSISRLMLSWGLSAWNQGSQCNHSSGLCNTGISAISEQGGNDPEFEVKVFENLRPRSNNLRSLYIFGYGGTRFPKWLGDVSFHLVDIFLQGSKDAGCEFLPSLGRLTSLRSLSIENMVNVQCVGHELCGCDYRGSKGFQSLERLVFHDMPKWLQWDSVVENGEFPTLHYLRLANCPKLRRLPQPPLSLIHIEILDCAELATIPNLPVIASLDLAGRFHGDLLSNLELTSLRSLRVRYSPNIFSLPVHSQRFPSLEHLYLDGLISLQSVTGLGSFTSLRNLILSNCVELQPSSDEMLPPLLQELKVLCCPKSREWLQHQNLERIGKVYMDMA